MASRGINAYWSATCNRNQDKDALNNTDNGLRIIQVLHKLLF